MVVQTRNNTASDRGAGEASLAVQRQGTVTGSGQATVPVKQQSSTSLNIMDLISSDLAPLSQEGKAIVSTIVKALTLINQEKDHVIENQQSKVNSLESKITKLEDQIDDANQYERRDTIIISGPALLTEQNMENKVDIVVNTIKANLHINIDHAEINIAHRLGPKQQNKPRPIIAKLLSRSKKSDIMNACVTIKPNIYINESLTPKHRTIYTTLLAIRKQHRDVFQQC